MNALSLPDLDTARGIHDWLVSGDQRADRHGWPKVQGYAPTFPGAADLYADLRQALGVPRPDGFLGSLRYNPPGWPQHVGSPLSTLAVWAHAGIDSVRTPVGDLAVTYGRLLEARRAARSDGGSRKYLKTLAERTASLTAPAIDEWRRTRLDLHRWADSWDEPPATPKQPMSTNKRGASWR